MGSSLIAPIFGGVLIGLSATLLWFAHGRIAGISSVLGRLLEADLPRDERGWRWLFLAGLILGGLPFQWLLPGSIALNSEPSWPLVVSSGLLVGFGTRLGSGCTSGHGVCGVSRLSSRSIVATLTFVVAGAVTVIVMKWLGGGA
jgi:uncharacterized protein